LVEKGYLYQDNFEEVSLAEKVKKKVRSLNKVTDNNYYFLLMMALAMVENPVFPGFCFVFEIGKRSGGGEFCSFFFSVFLEIFFLWWWSFVTCLLTSSLCVATSPIPLTKSVDTSPVCGVGEVGVVEDSPTPPIKSVATSPIPPTLRVGVVVEVGVVEENCVVQDV